MRRKVGTGESLGHFAMTLGPDEGPDGGQQDGIRRDSVTSTEPAVSLTRELEFARAVRDETQRSNTIGAGEFRVPTSFGIIDESVERLETVPHALAVVGEIRVEQGTESGSNESLRPRDRSEYVQQRVKGPPLSRLDNQEIVVAGEYEAAITLDVALQAFDRVAAHMKRHDTYAVQRECVPRLDVTR